MNSDNLGPIYSDNFKKWFGDWENDPLNSSKVVDSNGVPLPVYHGTVMKGKDGLPFKTFRTESDAGEGVMFADNYSVASFFSGHGEARFGNFEEKFEQWPYKDTMEGLVSFLNNVLKNGKYKISHFEGEYNGEHYEFYRLEHVYEGGADSSEFLGDTKEKAYENLMYKVKNKIEYMERDSKHAYTGGVYKVYLNIKRPYIFDAKGSAFYMLSTQFNQKRITVFDLVWYVKQTGQYDGVIVKNVRETTHGNGILTTDYIVFNSNQIKHALDNNGNFNPNIDDMTENKLRNYIKESIREVLLEGAETRNMKLAKHYLYQNKGFNEQQAMQCIGQIKTDIPNSRLAKCKFMLAMVRMFCDGELNDGKIIMDLNKSLKYAASEAHVSEYDNDLNGMTALQVVEKFAGNATDDLNQDKEEVGSQEYDEGSSHYKIVKINSFEEASEYQDYVSWCVTHYEDMFDSYTSNGNGVFYFCLRDGWQDETEEKGEGCPLDRYGLSMIAVSVNSDGSCNTITCRWNHDNGGNDNIMTTKQLSSIIGQNFYSVFKPLTPEEIKANQEQKLYEIQDEIENRCYYENIENFTDRHEYDPDYNDIVDVDVYVYNSDNGAVIIDKDGQFIIDYIFDGVNYRVGDTMMVSNGNKFNFVTLFKNEYGGATGKIISDTWFDKAHNNFEKGYGMVCMNKKWNLIDKNGQYLLKEWHDSVSLKDSNSNFVNVIDDGKFYYINTKTGDYVFDKSIDRIFYAPDNNLLLKFDGNNYYQTYDTNTLKLKAPWQISELGGTYNTQNGTFYRVKLTDGNSYNLDGNCNLLDTETSEIVYMNPMLNNTNESVLRGFINGIIKEIINEVRYIDTKYEKYNGKVQKNHWTDEYNQEPIKNGEKIRVFHGCELQTACQIAIEGTSGKTYHPRQYSYESGMNPLGIFVTTDFEVAKKFGVSNTGMCIIEFTADTNDLEAPVWNGQGTYFGQGTNPMPFNNADERNAQKMQYRKDAQNLEDDYYYMDGKKHNLSMSHVRNSDKPELANSIFINNEHQALFMGDLNPNMIKRIWVNLPGDNGYVHTSNAYRPMSVREFLKTFGNKEWIDYDYGRNRKYKIKKTRLFDPAENINSFDDLIDRLYSKEKNYFKTREEAAQCLKDQGMLQSPPSDYAYDTIKDELWPRQIIQLYGKDYFDKNFNKLGQ